MFFYSKTETTRFRNLIRLPKRIGYDISFKCQSVCQNYTEYHN